ncbi:hypothetical protein EB061_05950 [bacterium]|nr:hypothetical protein [bacterium]
MNNKRTLGLLSAALVTAVVMMACTESAKAKINMVFKDAPKAGVIAKINGEEITEEQLTAEAQLEIMQLKKQEYDLKMNLLNKMVTDRVLDTEAKKAGVANVEDYIKSKILLRLPVPFLQPRREDRFRDQEEVWKQGQARVQALSPAHAPASGPRLRGVHVRV